MRENLNKPNMLIDEILTKTNQELVHKPNSVPEKKPITPERMALIEKAMSIRRSKLHILNELDPEQLNKLTAVAIKALNLRIQK